MKLITMMMVAAMALSTMAAGPSQGKKAMIGPAGFGMGNNLVQMALNPKMREKLAISDEQVAKLKALPSPKEELKGLNEKVREGMTAQMKLLEVEKIDEAAVLKSVDEVWALRKQIAVVQMKRLIAVKTILTPEQIKKIREEMKSRQARRAERNAEKKAKKAEKAD